MTTRTVADGERRLVQVGNVGLQLQGPVGRHGRRVDLLPRQGDEQVGQLSPRGGHRVRYRAQSRRRHPAVEREIRSLHDGHATAFTDRHQAGGAVVQRAGQDDAHRLGAVPPSDTAEQRVDRRSVPVLLRSATERHMSVADDEVAVRGGRP